MELLNDFLNINSSFKRVIVPGSTTGGRLKENPEDLKDDHQQTKEEEVGVEYARVAREEEERAWREGNIGQHDDASSQRGGFGDIDESLSLYGLSNAAQQEEAARVYSTYDFSHRMQVGLPIEACKDKILRAVSTNSACVIQGATGCGKTTQVPQYILDYCRSDFKPCNIIVTQPRRLAAISVAKRVCKERKWTVGGIVGYQVGLNTCTSPDTCLTFCTTGVLLQRLISERSVAKYSHIILDEVHERDEDMDFTMMVVRKLLRQCAADTKVILMSATLDPDKYRKYFGASGIPGGICPAPLIDIDQDRKKKHQFTVNTYYLSQLQILGDIPDIQYEDPVLLPETLDLALKLIHGFDGLEQRSKSSDRGAVLVFLPGLQEIENFDGKLATKSVALKLWVRPLHSTITTDEQEQVFCRPPTGHRKIILSTNIAESSLTVPDIVYVIDFCLTKQLVCDPTTNFCSLQVTWVSKTNCIQRAGRAGRVRDGRVYRLVPQEFYDDYMPDDLPPEILRCPIDRTVLLAKLLKMGPPKHLLGLCLDPPDLLNIRRTILVLKEVGALLKTCNGIVDHEDGDITYLGYIMARLPLDIHVSKLIVLGHLFKVLDDCIIIGAALSLKNMFSAPFRERMAAYQSRLTWADGSCSDCVAFLNAFKVWKSHKEQGMFSNQPQFREATWANRYFLQPGTLREVDALVREVRQRLRHLGIDPPVEAAGTHWTEREKFMVLRFVIAGAFYPNYFVRSSQGGQVDEKEAIRQIVGRDPTNTVFLEGLPMDQPGELYTRAIKEALSDCASDMRVSFNSTSKIYIQFSRAAITQQFELNCDIPGEVCIPVYKAVKLRQLKVPIMLHLMPSDKAMTRARSIGLTPSQDASWRWNKTPEQGKETSVTRNLPTIDTSFLYCFITHCVDPGTFWIHTTFTRDRERELDEREIIVHMLNSDPLKKLQSLTSRPANGKLYAVPQVRKDGAIRYFRGRVLRTSPNGDKTVVFFIDSGKTAEVETRRLKDFGEELIEEGILKIGPQVSECCLSGVRPSMLMDARGLWCEEAKQALLQLKGNIYGKIYSVVHGVVYLELYAEKKLPFEDATSFESFNQYLVRKKWAESKEESYQSKSNHELRESASDIRMEVNAQQVVQELQSDYAKDWLQTEPDPELPKSHECNKLITLKGPFSPLEMKLFALTRIGATRAVHVDWSSVNSVLLDTEPQDPHERMMVACQVGENPDHNRLNLRNTSMLPNIHGLSSIICLVFSPTAEMRVNKGRSRFTGALCGLGVHPETQRPYFPDHDMEIAFDVKITLDDLQEVNKLRFWMTQGLFGEDDFDPTSPGLVNIEYVQGKVKEFFLTLLRCQRPPQEVELFPRPYVWNQVEEQYRMVSYQFSGQDRSVYPLHVGVELEDEPEPTMKDDFKKLNDISEGLKPWEDNIECKACKVPLGSLRLLQMHLTTQLHQEKERHACTPMPLMPEFK